MLSVHIPDASRVYRPGDEVHGTVKLRLGSSEIVSGVMIILYGFRHITASPAPGYVVPLKDSLVEDKQSLIRVRSS